MFFSSRSGRLLVGMGMSHSAIGYSFREIECELFERSYINSLKPLSVSALLSKNSRRTSWRSIMGIENQYRNTFQSPIINYGWLQGGKQEMDIEDTDKIYTRYPV